MQPPRPALRAAVLVLTLVALAGCSGMGGVDLTGSSAPPPEVTAAPTAPPVNIAGRWLFSSPGKGQCHMTFGSAGPTAVEGTIAPEGGCPGRFYMSRKWATDPDGITMRDHTGKPLAQLSNAGATFEGKATTGEPVTLMR